MFVYKVLFMKTYGDEEFFFKTKKSAITFIAKHINKREYRKIFYNNKWVEDPDRDLYEPKIDNKIRKMVDTHQYEKVSPYFCIYLSKHKLSK